MNCSLKLQFDAYMQKANGKVNFSNCASIELSLQRSKKKYALAWPVDAALNLCHALKSRLQRPNAKRRNEVLIVTENKTLLLKSKLLYF